MYLALGSTGSAENLTVTRPLTGVCPFGPQVLLTFSQISCSRLYSEPDEHSLYSYSKFFHNYCYNSALSSPL
jgi:hypothetical protein